MGDRVQHGHPLIAHAPSVGTAVAGPSSAAIILADTNAEVGFAVITLLLLGLTSVETPLALLTGDGVSPREAAGPKPSRRR